MNQEMAKFIISKGNDSQYYFKLRSGNNQVILQSEGYKAKASCENGIESVKTNAPNDSRYKRLESKNGKYYFNLTSTNGQVIGTSEMYESKAGRDNGIEAVKRDAPNAPVEDTTD